MIAPTKETDARILIDDQLRAAGWNPADKSQVLTEVKTSGCWHGVAEPESQSTVLSTQDGNAIPTGRADYVLLDSRSRPLAVIESKRQAIQPYVAKQQAPPIVRAPLALATRFGSGFLLLSWIVVLTLAACSRESSPEAEIRELVARAATAAEERNVRDLRAMIADDYADDRGLDRKAVENLIRIHVLRQQSIHLFARVRGIEFPESDRALASVAVAMAGRPVARADDLVGLTADLYRFDLELVRHGRSDWKVRRAAWEPARLEDFW